MSEIIVSERPDSRACRMAKLPIGTFGVVEETWKYIVWGTASEDDARAAVLAAAPATSGGLIRSEVRLEPEAVDEASDRGFRRVEVAYSLRDALVPAVGESSFHFEVGGQGRHINRSLETIARYGCAPQTAEDHGQLINVTGQGQDLACEGIDIPQGASYHFSETHILPAAAVTDAYKGALFALCLTTNAGAFKGLAIGEGLFLGASGSKRSLGDWEITYTFAGNPNEADIRDPYLTAKGFTVAIPKQGWHYVWWRYLPAVELGKLQYTVTGVYVERLFRAGDWTLLGLGT
ncbi:MAG TPA: hypothetical protein VMY35_02825 [Phycisphaerae bacterium]|nr:hypothetical protein [Phycisphaerae bacterium]